MHDQSGTGPDSVRTVSARELVDSAITATQRHVQEAIAVFESGAAWPADIDLCGLFTIEGVVVVGVSVAG